MIFFILKTEQATANNDCSVMPGNGVTNTGVNACSPSPQNALVGAINSAFFLLPIPQVQQPIEICESLSIISTLAPESTPGELSNIKA